MEPLPEIICDESINDYGAELREEVNSIFRFAYAPARLVVWKRINEAESFEVFRTRMYQNLKAVMHRFTANEIGEMVTEADIRTNGHGPVVTQAFVPQPRETLRRTHR